MPYGSSPVAANHETSSGVITTTASLWEQSREVSRAKPLIDADRAPTPTDGSSTGKTIANVNGTEIRAGQQYGPTFPTAEAATEYARLGLRQGWFGKKAAFVHTLGLSTSTPGAAVVKGETGYAVHATDLPRGFSTGELPTALAPFRINVAPMTAVVPPTNTQDVAGNLSKVNPDPSLTALVTSQGVIGDYRGTKPAVDFAGLGGDPTGGKLALLGPGMTGIKDPNLEVFGQAATDKAQGVLDKAQHASETVLGYTTETGLTDKGEKTLKTALNDTKDINEQIVAKQKEREKLFKERSDLLSLAARDEHSRTDGHFDRQKLNEFNKKQADLLGRITNLTGEIGQLHDKRGQILEADNAGFIQRVSPEKSLTYGDALNGDDARAKSGVAKELRDGANDVLGDVSKSRAEMMNGDFKWWQYDRLVQETASDLSYNSVQYKTLAEKVEKFRINEDRGALTEGGVALGLSLLPGGWLTRGGSLLVSAHMGANELNAYRTNNRLQNSLLDYDTPAENVFTNVRGAPSELGLGMAAIALIPDAGFLIKRSLGALKPGERISEGTLTDWVNASPKSSDASWHSAMLGQLNRIAQSYRKSGVAVREVEGAHFAQVTQNDRALGVFYVHRNEQGGVEAGVLMRHDLTPAERAEALTHDTLIHAEQFADPKMRPTMERLADLERRWPAMSDGEKLGAKQAQLEVEIDAYTRQLGRATSTVERENAGSHLAELNAELKDLSAGRVSADELAPPYLFARKPSALSPAAQLAKTQGLPTGSQLPPHHFWSSRTVADPATGKKTTELFLQRTDASKTDLYRYDRATNTIERIPNTQRIDGLNVVDGAGSIAEMDGRKIYDLRFSPLSTNPTARYRFSDPAYRKTTGEDVYLGENIATSYFEVRQNVAGKSLFIGKVRIDNMLDLTDPAVLKKMNIDPKRLTEKLNDGDPKHFEYVYGYTNRIANEAYAQGYSGIIYNSSRNDRINNKAVVLFGGRYDPTNITEILDVPIGKTK